MRRDKRIGIKSNLLEFSKFLFQDQVINVATEGNQVHQG